MKSHFFLIFVCMETVTLMLRGAVGQSRVYERGYEIDLSHAQQELKLTGS